MDSTEAPISVLDTIFSPGFKPVKCSGRHFNALDYIGISIVGDKWGGKHEDDKLKRGHQTGLCESQNENQKAVQVRLCDLNRKDERKKIASFETSGYRVVSLDDYKGLTHVPLDINENVIKETGACAHSFENGDVEIDFGDTFSPDTTLKPEITSVESLSETSFELLNSQIFEHQDLPIEKFDVTTSEVAGTAVTSDPCHKLENVYSLARKQSEDNTACLNDVLNETADERASEMLHDVDSVSVSTKQQYVNADTEEKFNVTNCSDSFEIYIDIDCVPEQTEKCCDPNGNFLSPDSAYGTEHTEQVCLNDVVERTSGNNLSSRQYSAFGFDLTSPAENDPVTQPCFQNTNKSSNETVKGTSETGNDICSKPSNNERQNKENFDDNIADTVGRKSFTKPDSELPKHVINVGKKSAKKNSTSERIREHKSHNSVSSDVKHHSKHKIKKDHKKVKSAQVDVKHSNNEKDKQVVKNGDMKKHVDETKSGGKVTGKNDHINMKVIKTSFSYKRVNHEMKNVVYDSDSGGKERSLDTCRRIKEHDPSLLMLKDTEHSETSNEQHEIGYTTVYKPQKNTENVSDQNKTLCCNESQKQEQKTKKSDSIDEEIRTNQKALKDKKEKVKIEGEFKSNSKLILHDDINNSEKKSKSSLNSKNSVTENNRNLTGSIKSDRCKIKRINAHKSTKMVISKSSTKKELICSEHATESSSLNKEQIDSSKRVNQSNLKASADTETNNTELKHKKALKERKKDCISIAKGHLNEEKSRVPYRKNSCLSNVKNISFQSKTDTNNVKDLSESETKTCKALKVKNGKCKEIQDNFEVKIHNTNSTKFHRQVESEKIHTECQDTKDKPKKRKISSTELIERTAKKRVLEWLEHHSSENVTDKEPSDEMLKPSLSKMTFKIPKRAKKTEPEKSYSCKDCKNSFKSRELLHSHIEIEHKHKREDTPESNICVNNSMDKQSSAKSKDRKSSLKGFKYRWNDKSAYKDKHEFNEKVRKLRHERNNSLINADEGSNKAKNMHGNLSDIVPASKQKQDSEKKYTKEKEGKENRHISETKRSVSNGRKDVDLLNVERNDKISDHKKAFLNRSRTESRLLIGSEEKEKRINVCEICKRAFDDKSDLTRHKELEHIKHSETDGKCFNDKTSGREKSRHKSADGDRSTRFDESMSDKQLKDTSDKCESTVEKHEPVCDDAQIALNTAKPTADKIPKELSIGNVNRNKPEVGGWKTGFEQKKIEMSCSAENEHITHVKNAELETVITKDTMSSVNVSQNEDVNSERSYITEIRMHKCELCEKTFFTEIRELIRHRYLKHSNRNGKHCVYNSSDRKRKITKYDLPESSPGKRHCDDKRPLYQSNRARKSHDYRSATRNPNLTDSPNELYTQKCGEKVAKIATDEKLTSVDTQVDNFSVKTSCKEDTLKPLLYFDVKPPLEVQGLVEQKQVEVQTSGDTTEKCNICNMIFFTGSMQRHIRIAHPDYTKGHLNSHADLNKNSSYKGGINAPMKTLDDNSATLSSINHDNRIRERHGKIISAKTDKTSQNRQLFAQSSFHSKSPKRFQRNVFHRRPVTEPIERYPKPWQCRQCKQRFSTKPLLKRHIKVAGHHILFY